MNDNNINTEIMDENNEVLINSTDNDDSIHESNTNTENEFDNEIYERGLMITQKINQFYPNYEYVYDEDNNIVDVKEKEHIITEEEINQYKLNRVQESKIELGQWLIDNPMQFTDGKYYSVTEEKQALLNGNLSSYERATKAGIDYPLKWNSTWEECVEWSYEDLLALSLSIAAYVAPRVSAQQALEIQIKNCTTMEELESIEIKYE